MVRCSLAGDELLAAVDVVGRAREGRVYHDVYRERGDVGRSDDASDVERGEEVTATLFEVIAEKRSRQGCVDEAGSDQVDPDWRELERQIGYKSRECHGGGRCECEAGGGAAAAGAAHEQQRAS